MYSQSQAVFRVSEFYRPFSISLELLAHRLDDFVAVYIMPTVFQTSQWARSRGRTIRKNWNKP